MLLLQRRCESYQLHKESHTRSAMYGDEAWFSTFFFLTIGNISHSSLEINFFNTRSQQQLLLLQAAIASAKAVALMVNILHHPLGARCPADTCASLTDLSTTPMGMVPHQIRGFLSHFRNVHPVAKYFPKCTACSDIVRDAYRKEGFEFCVQVFNDPKHVENLTGLSELQKSVEMIDLDWDDEDDDFE